MHEIVQYEVRQRKRENLHEDPISKEIRYELRQPEKAGTLTAITTCLLRKITY